MKKNNCLFFLFWSVLSVQVLFAQKTEFVKTKISDKITASLPKDFTLMPDNAYAKKYGAYRKPIAMYTNAEGTADFGVNVTVNRTPRNIASTEWKEEDLTMIKNLYKSSIAGMHDEVTFLQDKIVTINKRKFIVLEFVGIVRDQEKNYITRNSELRQYSYLQYAVDDSKILIFNFTCQAKYQPRWQPIVQEMMQSIKISGEL